MRFVWRMTAKDFEELKHALASDDVDLNSFYGRVDVEDLSVEFLSECAVDRANDLTINTYIYTGKPDAYGSPFEIVDNPFPPYEVCMDSFDEFKASVEEMVKANMDFFDAVRKSIDERRSRNERDV